MDNTHHTITAPRNVGSTLRLLDNTACLNIALGFDSPALGLVAGWAGLRSVFLAAALLVLTATVIAMRLLRAPPPGNVQL